MLKPLDIVVLAELVLRSPDLSWSQVELAQKLLVSQPSIHRALKQLEFSGLRRGRHIQRSAFFQIIVHAVRYVYPAELGAPTRGIPTAHAGSRLSEQLFVDQPYVWPLEEVDAYGPALKPLHPIVPKVALQDRAFHELMALVDVFRVGRARECRLAEQRLTEILDLQ